MNAGTVAVIHDEVARLIIAVQLSPGDDALTDTIATQHSKCTL